MTKQSHGVPETDAIEILIRLATDDNSHGPGSRFEDVGRRATAQLTALRARLEAAERENKELRADARRLNDLDSWMREVPGRALRLPREDSKHFALFLHPAEAEDVHRIVMKKSLREALDAIPEARRRLAELNAGATP